MKLDPAILEDARLLAMRCIALSGEEGVAPALLRHVVKDFLSGCIADAAVDDILEQLRKRGHIELVASDAVARLVEAPVRVSKKTDKDDGTTK